MSNYVISDIHGCYNEFLSMLERISFSEADHLILAGDYIDRGKQSYEILRWMEQGPATAFFMTLTAAACLGTESRSQSSPVSGWKMKKYFIYK